MIDPNDFIITRKRKKYKFAKFANSPLCFEFGEWQKCSADSIEIGAGTGLYSVELAERHPEQMYVAIDVKADRLQKGAYEAERRELTNIVFLRARADQVKDCFLPHSVTSIWLTFADPFPKKRSEGRRMSHPTYLRLYASLLKKGGSLLVKHDSLEFFTWSLEQLVTEGWNISELSFDVHESSLSEEYKILTTYESRWLNEGRTPAFVRATRPNEN